ncbi:GroES-like protein [Trametes sanguinea]|nr:GroES-like protein [Trametes sanguinea]
MYKMSVPKTQKSLLLREESTPYVVAETPVPRPGPSDVLVKIMACALNPVDWAVVDPPYSKIFIKSWPYVPGTDAAGVVVEAGAEAGDVKVGDRVLFKGDTGDAKWATCQQYAVVPAEYTAIIPENITFDEAATIPLALITDVLVLYNQSPAPENLSLRLKPVWEPEGATAYAGTPAFIVGGASSLGQFAIQLARMAGHSPIITTASPHNAPLLASALGATHVLDRARPNASILAELPTLARGKPIEFAFVAVPFYPEACRLGRDALAPGGALAVVVPAPGRVPEDVANPGDGKRVGYVWGSIRLPHTRDCGLALFKQITGWLEKGLLKPNPVELLPNGLAGINEGLAKLKANKVSGKKLVARPQDTP